MSIRKASDLLIMLRDSEEFRQVMHEMLHLRPQIPYYEPAETADEEQQQMNRIRHSSGMQKGFDSLYVALMGGKPS